MTLMTFHWPWLLWGLAVVGGVALWTLFRPGRQWVVVASLSLWRKAADALGRPARRSSRFVTASWLLLLAGAAAAVLAAAGPVHQVGRPVRRVALEVVPSAEIASPRAMGQLTQAVETLLDRLDEADEVHLRLPGLLGGSRQLSPREARSRVASLPALPVPAAELDRPVGRGAVQHAYRFAAAGAPGSGGPGVSLIEIPPDLPAATIDAAGAKELPGDRMQLFVALRGRGPAAACRTEVLLLDGATGQWRRTGPEDLTLGPGRRTERVETHPSAEAVIVTVSPPSGPSDPHAPGAAAFLVRRPRKVRRVAMLGRDEPLVMRFIRADAGMEFVTGVEEADLVVANGVAPPANKPALAINPPSPPPGWRRGGLLKATVLDMADVAADDPVMRHVNLAGVAIRRLVPWVAGESPRQVRLAGLAGDALILRSDPDARAAAGPRRVYVAFDMGEENTNFAMTDAFVILLANAMRWLAPGPAAEVTYGYETPLAAGPQPDWRAVGPVRPRAGRYGLLPAPGIYREPSGRLHAVSLPGLRSAEAPRPPAQAAAEAPLPDPERLVGGMELWPALAVAAMALWLAGWGVRGR